MFLSLKQIDFSLILMLVLMRLRPHGLELEAGYLSPTDQFVSTSLILETISRHVAVISLKILLATQMALPT